MIIDLSTINFVGGGGNATPAGKVEDVEVNIEINGVENPTLNEGFSAFGEVTVNSDNVTNSSALLFTQLNYDEELNTELNAKYNADIQYSKELLDKWNNGKIRSFSYDTKLIYAPKVDTSNITYMDGMFDSCTSLQFIPLLNTQNANNMRSMFWNCTSLTTIPLLDTSNVTNMEYMIYQCTSLQSLPLLDTSNVTIMSGMFWNCTSLTTIPLLNTQNVTNMSSMFYDCTSLTTIPQLNTSNVTNMNGIFYQCTSLQSLPLLDCGKVTYMNNFFGYSNNNALTEMGGFKDLKINWSDNNGLARCPNLTYQSIMNVLNNLYDFRTNGDDTTTRTIKINSNTYSLLTADDIAMTNGKGWNVTY